MDELLLGLDVLVKELQSLGLDIRVLNEAHEEIELAEDDDEETRFTDNIKIDGLEDTPSNPYPEEEEPYDEDDDSFDEFDDFGDSDSDEMPDAGELLEDDLDFEDDDFDFGSDDEPLE